MADQRDVPAAARAPSPLESFHSEEAKEEIQLEESRTTDLLAIPSTEELDDLSYGVDARYQPDCGGTTRDDSYYETDHQYILGTLIVRVVAARDLPPINNNGGLGGLFQKGGSSNPYANVRFMNVAQRTSEVYNTVDPVWPRGETMCMDVVHAPARLLDVETTTTTTTKDIPEGLAAGSNKMVDEPPTASSTKQTAAHPGDPPKKSNNNDESSLTRPVGKPKRDPLAPIDNTEENKETSREPPTLTVALFHARNDTRHSSKYPNKANGQLGDSDDVFLGMASFDLTHVLTGQVGIFDQWLPLTGTNRTTSSVRVVVEYEPSDATPQPGDIVQFTDFCHPVDLYPATTNREYMVMEVDNNDIQISWTSPEGWVSSFLVHRCMLIVLQRHHNFVDVAADELFSIRERISHSPMVHVVNETIQKVPDEGLLAVGVEAIQNGAGLLGRWWEGGLGTAAQDLNFATNWDGEQNPDTNLETEDAVLDVPPPLDTEIVEPDESKPALPNMPNCPITGEPMRDPVVAADGHTYERTAISRWFLESDKSPLTGSVLPHKELVPNYMLMSSLQEAAQRKPPPPELVDGTRNVSLVGEQTEAILEVVDDVTDDVKIDD